MIGTEEGSYTISGEYSDDGDEDYLTMRTDDIYRLPGAIAPSARNQE